MSRQSMSSNFWSVVCEEVVHNVIRWCEVICGNADGF